MSGYIILHNWSTSTNSFQIFLKSRNKFNNQFGRKQKKRKLKHLPIYFNINIDGSILKMEFVGRLSEMISIGKKRGRVLIWNEFMITQCIIWIFPPHPKYRTNYLRLRKILMMAHHHSEDKATICKLKVDRGLWQSLLISTSYLGSTVKFSIRHHL